MLWMTEIVSNQIVNVFEVIAFLLMYIEPKKFSKQMHYIWHIIDAMTIDYIKYL